MGKFINGVGFIEDLKQIDAILPSGYPVLQPGYIYTENTEYYIFASGSVEQLDGVGSLANTHWKPGTPYFIVDSPAVVDTMDVRNGNYVYVLDTSNDLTNGPFASGWVYNSPSGVYDFTESQYANKYIVYDTADSFTFYKDYVESTKLVISGSGVGNPFEIGVNPTWLANGIYNEPVPFYAKVMDNNGSLLEDEYIKWYKVYAKPSGLPPSGISPGNVLTGESIIRGPWADEFGEEYYDVRLRVGSNYTDENGISQEVIIPGPYEKDLFIYAQWNLKSKLVWLQSRDQVIYASGIFQLDNPYSFYTSQEALTAVGIDVWGDDWSSVATDALLTSNPMYLTRGTWKAAFPELERPPIIAASGVNETVGFYNGYDFNNDYAVGDVWNFMSTNRLAIQGYWGQVIVSGYDIRTIAALDAQCQNPIDWHYTIDYKVGGVPDYYAMSGHMGTNGTWDDVKNATGEYDTYFYVLYAPGYTGNAPVYFQSNPFYFRGLAVINLDSGSADYLNQDYYIQELISFAKLID